MAIEANVNNTACIVQKSHIGYDAMINICSGVTTNVLWTGLDWFVASLAIIMFLVVVWMAFYLIRDFSR